MRITQELNEQDLESVHQMKATKNAVDLARKHLEQELTHAAYMARSQQ